MSDPIEDIKTLVKCRYPLIGIQSWEEERIEYLLQQVSLLVNIPLFVWTSTRGLARYGKSEGMYNSLEPMQVLNIVHNGMEAIYLLKDFHHYLQDKLISRKLRDLCTIFHSSFKSIVISSPNIEVPLELKKDFVLYDLQLPNQDEIYRVMMETMNRIAKQVNFRLKLPREDLLRLAREMTGLTQREVERVISRAILSNNMLSEKDIGQILEFKKNIVEEGGILEYYHDPIEFPYIGGFKRFKVWLSRRKGAFSGKAREHGLQFPRGVLLLGVPGCGKSLCSRIIAKYWGLPLLKLDPAGLYDKYIGETEKNLRAVIKLSEAMAPAVLWIDEIEKGFSLTGSSDPDGGLSKRILGTFLNWMQEKKKPVFIVATSNDVSLLPPEFLRKGRFDEIFFVDLPRAEERLEIFKILLTKHKQKPAEFDLPLLVANSEGFSGAEIEQAITSALYSAFSGAGKVTTKLILEELEQTHPLSETRREDIEELREWARERAVMVS
ncbi:AAA family ATPase [bacterium]|nr:AAA family ATPase [bacterium]